MRVRGVAFCGVAGVGKSTAASFARDALLGKSYHVKDVLGECVAPLLLRLGVPLDELERRIYGDLKDAPLPLAPNLSTTKLLQAQGNGFLKDCGDELLAQRLAIARFQPGTILINESVRFAREVPFLREQGFRLVRITRPGYEGKATLDGVVHESERDQTFDVDFEIQNTGSLVDLNRAVHRALSDFGLRMYTSRGQLQLGHLVLVNGKPRAGKDSFCDAATAYAAERYGVPASAFSTIDGVRKMLTDAGIDVSAKTPADRRLLSVVGEEAELHSSFKTVGVIRQARECLMRGIAFVHVREPHTMDRLSELAREVFGAVWCRRLWLARPNHDPGVASNASDAVDGTEVSYDFSLVNDGSLSDLACSAADFVDALLTGAGAGHFSSAGKAPRST